MELNDVMCFTVCKYFATELKSRLDESAKSKEVIETGHGLDKKKRFKYRTSYVQIGYVYLFACRI